MTTRSCALPTRARSIICDYFACSLGENFQARCALGETFEHENAELLARERWCFETLIADARRES